MREQAGTPESECAERSGGALRFRSCEGNESEVPRGSDTAHISDFQSPQLQLLRNRPARNKAYAKSCFHRGLYRFGGVQVHDVLEGLQLEMRLFKSHLDDTARARTLFAHQQICCEELSGRQTLG